MKVDQNLSGRGICQEGSLISRKEAARSTGLILPILASVNTITIKGEGDKESHHARAAVPDNWKELWTIEGFLLDMHAMPEMAFSPQTLPHFLGRT